METTRKRGVKGLVERTVSRGHNGVKKSTRRSSLQLSKATGRSENLLVEKDEKNSSETTKRLPFLELCPGQTLEPSTKVKLQLFPIDEGTRIGLEKDGCHPYLELTLSARKKISSVLKHLNSKWGSSSIALGEPMLFPYNTLENLASYRWTLNDSDVSAGDVYAAIGSPAIFRLRYCWFSGSETKTTGVPSTSTPFGACFQSERVQRGCSANMENTHGKRKQIEVTSEEFVKPVIGSEATHVVTEKMSSNEPVDPTDNEVTMDTGIGQSSTLWADSLTNISIGGLLSEASLQGRFNHCDPKSNGSNAGLQPSQLISDSFDSFLAGQINHSQGPRLPPQDSRSSILDAEDTCHAFSFQKLSSSEKDALCLGGSAYSQIFSQDAGSKSFKFRNLTKANNIQSGLPQGRSQESETDLQLCSRVYNDESSLGLSGIKWTDSLGPFDLGLSSSQKIISGDNISIGGIVN